MITIKVHRLSEGAILPRRATVDSAGFDLFACLNEDMFIEPSQTILIPTGIALEIPPGYEAQVRPRSGMVLKQNFLIPNAPGTIDADYRGEIKVLGSNRGHNTLRITPDQRIAQLIFQKLPAIKLEEVDTLTSTKRGSGGFGHSGS